MKVYQCLAKFVQGVVDRYKTSKKEGWSLCYHQS